MPRCFSIFLCILFLNALGHAQKEAGWKEEIETFERIQARSLLPVHQALMDELRALEQTAAKGGDARQRLALDAEVAIAQQRQRVLEGGRLPHPNAETVLKEAFVRRATGTQWALTGTRNLKRVGVIGGTLHGFSEDGMTDQGETASEQVAPGVFTHRRRDGSGWTCHLIAPDLRHFLCLIVPKMHVGYSVTPALAIADEQPKDVEVQGGVGQGEDSLRALLEARFREKLLQQEKRLIDLIEGQLTLNGAKLPAGEAAVLSGRLLQAKVACDLLRRPIAKEGAMGAVETAEVFRARLSGREWQVLGLRALSRIRFDGEKRCLQALNAAGAVAVDLPTEMLWPGALRVAVPDGSAVVLYFPVGLDRVVVFPVLNQFPGLAAR